MATSRSSPAAVASLRKDAARGVGEPELPFRRVLIANRGEIAVRIIRACHELGIEAIAIYSDADAHALHTRLADVAIRIGPPAPAESYLRIDGIIDAALATGADASTPATGSSPSGRPSHVRWRRPDSCSSARHRTRSTRWGTSCMPADSPARWTSRSSRARSSPLPSSARTRSPRSWPRRSDRVPVAGQGSGRRRRTRDAPGRDAGGVAGRPRSRLGGGDVGVRRRRRLSRAGDPSRAPHRGAAARRCKRPGRGHRRARLLHPAAPPEARRGGAGARIDAGGAAGVARHGGPPW